ncbi:dephospho-CoA kinase [Streptococcus sp. ST2]|uniref:dephospho-CoA kinase n=1 Tax=Streptococcus taoyuanensis TaxID=3036443 RepID=UPI00240FE701|nr:dephospho-CoA kinase [Streptococcus sp. ST2]MDG3028621.1 dephospho-CoA kinase [Streptococcus sp. ST2]
MARIIGLTGGIASGKSTVTSYLKEKGYPVIDADQVVRELQVPGGALYRVLVDHFGKEILTKEGELDRVALGQRIFSDPSERDWSNRVQGRLIREALAEVRDRQATQSDLFFMDIPLLIEQGYEEWFESVWLVAVSKETQLKRLMERNHLSELQAQERIASQMPLDEKSAHADLVLDNNDDLTALYAQLDAALQQLERR